MKFLSPSEAETKRQQAIEFLHRIGKDDEAERFEAMSPREYGEHRGAELLENPNRRNYKMAQSNKTKDELQDELDEAQDYIEELEGKLDDIAGIATDEDDGESDGGDDQDDSDSDDVDEDQD